MCFSPSGHRAEVDRCNVKPKKPRDPGKTNGFLTTGHCGKFAPMQFQFQETQGPWKKKCFLTSGHCGKSDPMQFQFHETQGRWQKTSFLTTGHCDKGKAIAPSTPRSPTTLANIYNIPGFQARAAPAKRHQAHFECRGPLSSTNSKRDGPVPDVKSSAGASRFRKSSVS